MKIQDIRRLETLRSVNGSLHHMLFQEDGRQFQVVLSGSIDTPATFLTPVAIEGWRARPQLNAIACFQDLCNSGRLRPKYFPAEPRRRRLAAILTTLDLWLAGASHRQIGEAIYGSERIDRDWNDPGDHLKDGVRRLVSRGRMLMTGGYRTLLR